MSILNSNVIDIDENNKVNSDDESDFELHNPKEVWSTGKANRRTKERKISFVIEKVSVWRKLYNGITQKDKRVVRYGLEEAAKKVGISKKSLDDYLL